MVDDLRHHPSLIVGMTAILILCVLVGATVTQVPATYSLVAAGICTATAVGVWNRGALAGLLVLLMLDGVPFVAAHSSSKEAGANSQQDLIFLALLATLGWSARSRTRTKNQRQFAVLALQWGIIYLAWWGFKVIAQSPGVPLTAAVDFGRDFLEFALFLPLAFAALPQRRDLIGFGVMLAVGASLFAFGQVATQIGHANVSWLIHVSKTNNYEGVTRIYAPMNDLLMAAFPMAFAGMILGPKQWRYCFAALALLTGIADALSFTRALYVSEIVAIVIVSIVWTSRSRRIRRFLLSVVVIVCVFLLFTGNLSATNSPSSPVATVFSRIELGLTNAQEQNGNVGYRLRQVSRNTEIIAGHWIVGLGFLPPAYHYVPGLREGSIRDSDLGSLAIIMTMGLVGLILAYIPALAALRYLLKRRRGFIAYGGTMYLVAAIVGSVTLGPFASISGLLVLGSSLAFCCNWIALPNNLNTG